MSPQPNFPHFLQNYANLQNHFEEQFEDDDSNQRGDKFADFVEKLILKTDFGRKFTSVERQKRSHDGGVDFIARATDGAELWVQSKYRVKGKEDFDRIISKWQNRYEEVTVNRSGYARSLFSDLDDETSSNPSISFWSTPSFSE
jgi:hypothetical protein